MVKAIVEGLNMFEILLHILKMLAGDRERERRFYKFIPNKMFHESQNMGKLGIHI